VDSKGVNKQDRQIAYPLSTSGCRAVGSYVNNIGTKRAKVAAAMVITEGAIAPVVLGKTSRSEHSHGEREEDRAVPSTTRKAIA